MTSANCTSGVCTSGLCQGVDEGEACTNSKQCNIGLYCDTTCQPTKAEDESCVAGKECGFGMACHDSKCTLFGTVDIGEEIDFT